MCPDQHVKYRMSGGFPLTSNLLLDYYTFTYRCQADRDVQKLNWNISGNKGGPGEKGAPGDISIGGKGERGYPGISGRNGDPGADGRKGEPGRNGFRGLKGQPGRGILGDKGTGIKLVCNLFVANEWRVTMKVT